MIGLDTSVLVRYIMQDDPIQARQAEALVDALTAEDPGYVPLITLVELVRVLDSCFDLRRVQLAEAVEAVLRTREFVIENADTVWNAVRAYRAGSADFADCLIERSAAAAGCDRTMTFDLRAAKSGGMTLIQ